MSGSALWTAAQVAGAVGAQVSGDWTAAGVSIDSRTVRPRDLFVALKGPNFDAHDYLPDAFDRGAAAAIVDHKPATLPAALPLVVVADTYDALTALGAAGRERSRARIAAVTGSVGKTGTKDALRHCLERQAATAANVGNLNNQIGVPLSLARMPPDVSYGVFEIGMNSPGEIGALSRLVRPDVAVITTVAAVHIAAFASLHELAEEKAAIFEGMGADGVAILNRENAFFPVLVEMAKRKGIRKIIGFGAHREADARLIDCVVESTSTAVSAVIDGSAVSYRLGLSGRHHALNSLAVLAAVKALGADIGAAAVALGDVAAAAGRGRQHTVTFDGGSITLVDDSYNASPISMRAAFEALQAVQPGLGGRRIAALGDMLELGADAPKLHAALADSLVENGFDLVFTAGPAMSHLHDALPRTMRGVHATDSAALAPLLIASLSAGDVIVVKGSHGSRMDVVVDAIMGLVRPEKHVANGR
jgi:UDP-N-acetylmuramoyl-tripeptide--D-alanyl-D-alanine ligase